VPRTRARKGIATAAAIAAIAGIGPAISTGDTSPASSTIVYGNPGVDAIYGTAGNDTIYAGPGNHTIYAGTGNADIYPGSGTDTVVGGPGDDTVIFTGTDPLTVTLDGRPDSGTPGQDDTIDPNVSGIYGNDGSDTLVGNGGNNLIVAGNGSTKIVGGGGNDVLIGGAGNDTIDARGTGSSFIDCGTGHDTVYATAADVIASDCRGSRIIYGNGKGAASLKPALTLRDHHVLVSQVEPGSTLVIACVRGCRPARSPSKPLVKITAVKLKTFAGFQVVLLPWMPGISGATIEIGAAAPGSRAGCERWRVGAGFRSLTGLARVKCTTVAKDA
jgi:Ca2+-binding RTX toxin-like protein